MWYEGEWGAEYYMEEWETGFLSNFSGMIDALKIGGLILIVVSLVVLYIGRKKDPAPSSW
jgi:hypothetical protein